MLIVFTKLYKKIIMIHQIEAQQLNSEKEKNIFYINTDLKEHIIDLTKAVR